MADYFPWIVSLLLAALVIIVFQFASLVGKLKREISKLNNRLEALDAQLDEQKKQVEEMQAARQQKAVLVDPLVNSLQSLSGLKSNGVAATLISVGSILFKAYLRKGKRTPLPTPKENQ